MAGTSYTRQSTLTDGDTITASLFNAEYNQLVSAFSYAASSTTGHQHDGSAGEGGNIHTIGDQDFKNKIVVDSTNNRWSVYVEVGGTAVEQVRIEDGVVYPVTDSDVDLGTDALRFKAAYIDSITATTSLTLGTSITVSSILDEDDMSSDSATALATQQSIKAYVDAQVTAQDLDLTDGTTSISIDLDSEALSVLGGTGIDSTASGNGVTLAIDSTVATLTGSQTLTNKTLTSPDINTPDIDGGTIDGTVIGGSSAAAGSFTTVGATGNITVGGTVDGRDVATDGTKLDGIEASADVTDTTNVTAAGALMDSEVTNLAQVKAFDSSDYATAAQGATADAALPKAGGAMTGAITTNSTFDGRDVATDGTKLDGIEASADVTDTTNVTAAGALMDSELTSIASVKALDQGVATTDSPQFVGITSTSNVIVGGNLTVNGTTTTLNTASLDVEDKNITINYGSGDTTGSANGAGITIQDAVDASTDATILWDTTNDEFDFSHPINVAGASTFAGLTSTGEITANGGIALGDNDKATFGASDDLQIYHDGSNSVIKDLGTGDLRIGGSTNVQIWNDATSKISANFNGDGAATLYNNGSAKLATTSGGIQVTGDISNASGDLTLDVAGNINLDADGGEFRFKDGGTLYATAYQGGGGSFYLATAVQDKDLIFQGNDGGSTITALTLDMSNAGAATFNAGVTIPDYVIHDGNTSTKFGFGSANTMNFISNGSDRLTIANSYAVFNEAGTDYDFRVESSGNANMLFVDGGNNRVGIGTSSPSAPLTVNGTTNLDDTNVVGQLAVTGGISSTTRTDIQTTADVGPLNATTLDSSAAVGLNITYGTSNVAAGDGIAIAMGISGRGRSFIGNTNEDANNDASNFVVWTENGGVLGEKLRIKGDGSIVTTTSGSNNTRLGLSSGVNLASGSFRNTLIGDYAGEDITTGDYNIGVGYQALTQLTTGERNTALGYQTLRSLTSTAAAYNVAIGFAAGELMTTGVNNTLVGSLSGDAVTTGSNNTALGYGTLSSNTTASNNVAVGHASLATNTTGAENVAVGNLTLDINTTGERNTALGGQALSSNTTASANSAVGYKALLENTTGTFNTALGHDALRFNTTASNNTAVGLSALRANTTGGQNTAVGVSALLYNTTGIQNIASGLNSMYFNTTGNFNTSYGVAALQSNTTASNNTAVGHSALAANTTGNRNVAVGTSALDANTTADGNTAVGYDSLSANTGSELNVAVGFQALRLYNNTSGSGYNTAVGALAGDQLTTGTQNTLIGGLAGDAITTGTNNTAVGTYALTSNTTASNNTAVGTYSGNSNITGAANTSLGAASFLTNTTGSYNTALGGDSLRSSTTASHNTAVGYNSLRATTTGASNVAVGDSALDANTIGSDNVALGRRSLTTNTTGGTNTAVGLQALYSNTTASNNTAVGASALFANTTGAYNVAVGVGALDANTTGRYNNASGYHALGANTTGEGNTASGMYSLRVNTTASGNTAFGWDSMMANTTGAGNVAIGKQALVANTTGGSNTAVGTGASAYTTTGSTNASLGQNSLYTNATGSGNTCLGREAGYYVTGGGNVVIGSSNSTATGYIPAFNITSQNNYISMGNSDVTNAYIKVAWTVTSDARDKSNFAEVPHGLSFVNQLAPYSYEFKHKRTEDETDGIVRYGFKAQDILALEGDNPVIIDNEDPDSLRYRETALIPILVKAIQELTARIETLEGK